MKIVTREDLVSKYLGQTASKTNEFLQDNLGNVLFIDDSVYYGENDHFGSEAVETLELFLKENPDKITIIFTK